MSRRQSRFTDIRSHLPPNIGFYDLGLPESRVAQADLARGNWNQWICLLPLFVHGKQFRKGPSKRCFRSGDPRLFPFCLCWVQRTLDKKLGRTRQGCFCSTDY